MKITKTQLKRIIKEELTEVGQWGLGVSGASTRSVADPHTAAIEALAGYIRNRYREDQKLLDLLQAAEEAVTDFENTMTEGFGLVGALSAVKDAENQGMADAQDDFMRSQRGEEVSPDLPSFGSAEEEDAYGMAWGKEWHRLMDIAAKSAAERKLNRPPEPMTDADREAAEAELDFEATYSEGTDKMKITKSKLAQIIQEELAAVTLQEAPLPADEYEDTVEYLWSQNLSDIVLPFKHATSLDGEFPPAIETIVDYWEKKDFKGMASEWLDLRDELDDWLESRGFNWSIRTEEDPGSRYVDYSIPNGKKGRMPRNVIDTNFKHAFRLIRMLINSPPPDRGYTGFGVGNDPNFLRQQDINADTLGRRPQQERKITKSALAQIVKEELAAIKAEGYGNYKRDDMSPHAKDMAKNKKKGYSPQAAVTAVPDNEEVEKRLHKMGVGPYSDKPRRGKKGLGESQLASRESLEEMIKKELMEMIKK